jgi:hypothetical protein
MNRGCRVDSTSASIPLRFWYLCLIRPIQRQRPGATRQQKEQNRSPGQMLRPGIGVDKELNDQDHPQEREGRSPCRQPESEQARTAQLEGDSQHRGDLRGQH